MNKRAARLWVAVMVMGVTRGAVAGEVTAMQWLAAQAKPVFREGNTLPPLTRYGWTLPLDARYELAERWGYALEFSGGYLTDAAANTALNNPWSEGGRILTKVESDPKKYKLCVILSRDLPSEPAGEIFVRDAEGKEPVDKNGKAMKVWSPEAGRSVLEAAAELRAGPLRRLRARVPVAVVLNGGEYALGVLGFNEEAWGKDPRIVKAKGERAWFDYISEKKGLMEGIIAEAVKKADPDRELYIYYTSGGGKHRNRTKEWFKWCYGYEWMRGVSDLPNNDYYYPEFNTGWTGENDLLTQAMNARGEELRYGHKYSYDWLCAGWIVEPKKKAVGPANGGNAAAVVDEPTGKLSDLRLYTGFLKCLYTAGTLGGNGGYYAFPKGGFGAKFRIEEPPYWLTQMVRLSHVHAFFSWREEFVRESDLLPGPGKHRWSTDQPAYEFPAGEGVRVLARRHAKRAEWLITAWAADGRAREVEVEVPELGKVKLNARAEGSVYFAKVEGGAGKVELLDGEGMEPTVRR